MGFFMNGKLIDLKILNKHISMKKKELQDIKMHSADLGERDSSGNTIYRVSSTTTSTFKNYTETNIEFIDESTGDLYTAQIIEDDFLPTVNSTIKTYFNDEKKLLAYQPYKDAKPIVVKANFPEHGPTDIIAKFIYGIMYAIPVITIPAVWDLRKACKSYKDGNETPRYLLNIFLMLFFVSFQVYFTYYLYDHGRKYFWEAMGGYLSGGIVIGIFIALSEFANMLNLISYQSKIRRKFQ